MILESHQSEFNGPLRKVGGIPFACNAQPMWISDVESHIFLDVNDAALRQYGYSRAQFLAMSTFDLRSENQPGSSHQFFDPLLKAPRTAEPYMHHAQNGSVFAVAITSWQQFTFNGRPAELALIRKTDSAPSQPS
jgi:PAS domain S-box-containing protein